MLSHVCIVIPPSPFLLDERVFPFLGPLKVAASLEQRGVAVDVLDLSGISNYTDPVADYAANSEAQCFGVTATTPQFPAAVEIARCLRRIRPDARIIIGGTHATLVVAARKHELKHGRSGRALSAFEQLRQCFDVIVAGDGEDAVFLALEEAAPGLIDADDRKSPHFLTNERLDHTPYPARHLIDLPSYRYMIDGVPATSLIAQLGCPYKCGFCAGRASPMLRNIRMRSDESIVAEMTLLYRTYGYQGFMFYDDELNVNPQVLGLMEKLAKAQRDLGVEWKLRGFVKSERFTEAHAEAMREAGFRQVLIGFESGSPRILENIQKIASCEDNTRCMDIARRYGIRVKALMSLGHPGESPQTIEETRRWLVDARPSDFDASIITPYPGSPYYDEAVPCAILSHDVPVWSYAARNGDLLYQEEVDYAKEAHYYKGNPDEGYASHVWTDRVSREELVLLRDELERSVRERLDIPFNPSNPAVQYEHSMGQGLPPRVLRSTPRST